MTATFLLGASLVCAIAYILWLQRVAILRGNELLKSIEELKKISVINEKMIEQNVILRGPRTMSTSSRYNPQVGVEKAMSLTPPAEGARLFQYWELP